MILNTIFLVEIAVGIGISYSYYALTGLRHPLDLQPLRSPTSVVPVLSDGRISLLLRRAAAPPFVPSKQGLAFEAQSRSGML